MLINAMATCGFMGEALAEDDVEDSDRTYLGASIDPYLGDWNETSSGRNFFYFKPKGIDTLEIASEGSNGYASITKCYMEGKLDPNTLKVSFNNGICKNFEYDEKSQTFNLASEKKNYKGIFEINDKGLLLFYDELAKEQDPEWDGEPFTYQKNMIFMDEYFEDNAVLSAEKAYKVADQQLNLHWSYLEPDQRQKLLKDQRAWIKNRDAICGTIKKDLTLPQKYYIYKCLEMVTQKRAFDLVK